MKEDFNNETINSSNMNMENNDGMSLENVTNTNSDLNFDSMSFNDVPNIEPQKEEEKNDDNEHEKCKKTILVLIIIIIILLLLLGGSIYMLVKKSSNNNISVDQCSTRPQTTTKCVCDDPKIEEETTTTTTTTGITTTRKTTVGNRTTARTTTTTAKPSVPQTGNTVIETPKELKIVFENVQVLNGSTYGSIPVIINNTSLNFDINLYNPNDYYSFTVDIVNKSNMDAKIDNYISSVLTEEQSKYLTLSLAYNNGEAIKKGDYLKAGESKKLKFTASFKNVDDELWDEVSVKFLAQLIYVQAS